MSEQKSRTKQQILESLEQQILIIAGDIRIHCIMGGDPTGSLAKNEGILGEMLKGVLEIKQLEGIPSNLSIVENLREQV